jgi:hypothetical protein
MSNSFIWINIFLTSSMFFFSSSFSTLRAAELDVDRTSSSQSAAAANAERLAFDDPAVEARLKNLGLRFLQSSPKVKRVSIIAPAPSKRE